MLVLHILMLVLYTVLGVGGLIFKIDSAVFIGLVLFPWEIRMILAYLGKPKPGWVKFLVLISGLVGLGYFIYMAAWVKAGLLLLVEVYIYWVASRPSSTVKS